MKKEGILKAFSGSDRQAVAGLKVVQEFASLTPVVIFSQSWWAVFPETLTLIRLHDTTVAALAVRRHSRSQSDILHWSTWLLSVDNSIYSTCNIFDSMSIIQIKPLLTFACWTLKWTWLTHAHAHAIRHPVRYGQHILLIRDILALATPFIRIFLPC